MAGKRHSAEPVLGAGPEGDLLIDLPKLLESRMLIQANSGGGKSWALRRFLEQTATHTQQIIIDPEGEFASLREKFDYIICAPHGGDAAATPQTAAVLGRKLRELRVSAILDIYDLKKDERETFVQRFLDALMAAPKNHWHPALVVIDEAQLFAPEQSKAVSLPSVIDLATRGRKRGLALVCATQRLSKLHKDVAAELLNKLIGRTGLDIDVRRAGDELGMTPKDAMATLRNLDPGQFYAFGPALTRSVTKLEIGDVITTHPKVGSRLTLRTPAPSSQIKGILQELADLPKEAAEEAKTIEQLRSDNTSLKRQLTAAQKSGPADPQALEKVRQESAEKIAKARSDGHAQGLAAGLRHGAPAVAALRKIKADAEKALGAAESDPVPVAPVVHQKPSPQKPVTTSLPRSSGPGEKMAGGERRILIALAQYPSGRTKRQVGMLAGYAINGGGFNNYLSALRSKGWMEGSGENLRITNDGVDALGHFDPLPTGEDLINHWKNQLDKAPRAILTALVDTWPSALSKDAVAAATGYEPGGGGFNNALSRLRTLELIEGKGEMKASDDLFPEAA